MAQIIGWIGVVIVTSAFILLNKKRIEYFLIADIIGSSILALHAYMIGDLPFILFNLFISFMCLFKLVRLRK